MSQQRLNDFFEQLQLAATNNTFTKLTLGNRRNEDSDLKNVYVKPVAIKAGIRLSFVYRHATKDITKNYEPTQAVEEIKQLLAQSFYNADLYTTASAYHLSITPKNHVILSVKPNQSALQPDLSHNRDKNRLIHAANNIYLEKLGVVSANGLVKNDKQDKFRQINKYVEVIDSIIKEAGIGPSVSVADMGSGKGYLTFALYDYLRNTLRLDAEVVGVELRQELVDKCNAIAAQAGFTKLSFVPGYIDSSKVPPTNMLIALHACDIATDQAICKGITNNAQIIVCAPCCHKQVRKQLHPANVISSITQFGIMEERQAEILTDTIRALILEAYGYKTKVFEFIGTEHTPKNILITAIKINDTQPVPNKDTLEKLKALKHLFGLDYHALEKMMGLVDGNG